MHNHCVHCGCRERAHRHEGNQLAHCGGCGRSFCPNFIAPGAEVFKVQISTFTTTSERKVLMYNRDRSVVRESDYLPGRLPASMVDGKIYVYGRLEDDGGISIEGEAPGQVW